VQFSAVSSRSRARDVESLNEDELLCAVAGGDHDAYSFLFEKVSPAVIAVARQVLRDFAQADEVAQEVLVEVWRRAPNFDPAKGRARTWILTIAHRRATDRVRHEEAAASRDRRYWSRIEREYDVVAEQVEANLERDDVREALRSLTALQRAAIELAYFEGHTYVQVAEALNVPVGTASTRIRDALIRLRDVMGVTP